MSGLSDNEKRILVRISLELAARDQKTFVEFPSLSEKDVQEGMRLLKEKELISLDDIADGVFMWQTTDKGDRLLQEHRAQFKRFIEEFHRDM